MKQNWLLGGAESRNNYQCIIEIFQEKPSLHKAISFSPIGLNLAPIYSEKTCFVKATTQKPCFHCIF